MSGNAAQVAIEEATAFAKRCQAELGVEHAWLFGSLVYRNGERFADDVSDVDLAIAMPRGCDTAVSRAEFATRLLSLKIDLETKLVTRLSRTTTSPVCSLLPVSESDIAGDIHKDGAEGFFAANEFLDVLDGQHTHGLPGAGAGRISHRLIRQCLRFAQKKRHAFLSAAANSSGSLDTYEGDLPLPKDTLRHAAMVSAVSSEGGEPGAEFDVQEGLGELMRVLLASAKKEPAYEELRGWLLNKIATRKGSLDARHQLLLAEIIGHLAELAYGANEKAAKEKKRPAVESTPFFYDRVGEAFPGKRGIYWTTGAEDVQLRLERLLGGQLRFDDSTPIWMFRGGGSMPIANFEQLGPETFVIGHDELKVSKLALYQSESYYRCFVYVECEPLAPTGVYPEAAEWAARRWAEGMSFAEEYGITDDGLLLTREEYDDGAAERDGRIIDTTGRSRLRVRYLTPYNFLLCAQMCPINNNRFDPLARELLDRMLKGEDLFPLLAAEVEKLPRRDDS